MAAIGGTERAEAKRWWAVAFTDEEQSNGTLGPLPLRTNSCVALALLTGCGGNASTRVVPVSAAPDFLRGQKTFHYIDAAQHFRVPAGLRQINVDVRGAKGAGSQ